MSDETKPATAPATTPTSEPAAKPAPQAATLSSPSAPGAASAAGAPAPAQAPAAAVAAKPAATTPAAATPAATPAAKPAAPAPKKDEASPSAPRPSVVYAGIAALSAENIVVPHLHTVRPGDTLELLAQEYYGDRKKAQVIAAANKDVAAGATLVAGTKVKVPKD